jgi:hypothetical protein
MARSPTVHLRPGAAWMALIAGASTGSRRAASQPRSAAGALARCKGNISMSSSSGSLVDRSPRRCRDDSSRAYAMLASNQDRAGPGGGRATKARGNAFRAGSNRGPRNRGSHRPRRFGGRPRRRGRSARRSTEAGSRTPRMDTGSTGSAMSAAYLLSRDGSARPRVGATSNNSAF